MFTTKQHDPDFQPPFCPNQKCRFHNGSTPNWRFKKTGFFWRQAKPHRIQRFTCLHCRRSFSSQTFSVTYWLRRPDIYPQLMTKTVGCMANRQISRDLSVSPPTIDRQLERLGRHCMLFHARMMTTARPLRDIVIDGFVTFEKSQYQPFHHHIAVEKGTDFFAYFTDSEVRRSGTMTPTQKRRRVEFEQRFGRPDPQAVRNDVRELLSVVFGSQPEVTISSDDHRAYPAAMRGIAPRLRHRVTSSRERRDNRNPLWEINLTDLLIRHCGANHKRETIAWSKRRQASAERLAIFLVWRNYMKGRREKVRGSPTPAMARGMGEHPLTVGEILEARLFPSQVALPPRWARYYARSVVTRGLDGQCERVRVYAA